MNELRKALSFGVAVLFALASQTLGMAKSGATTQGEDAETHAVAAVGARMQMLQNLRATFESTQTDTPDLEKIKAFRATLPPSRQNFEPRTGKWIRTEQAAYLGRRVKLEWNATSGHDTDANMLVWVDTPGRAESLVTHKGFATPVGVIANTLDFPDSTIDLGLGLRCYQRDQLLDPDNWTHASVASLGDGRFSFIMKTNDSDETWIIDPKVGYAPVHYEQQMKDGKVVAEVQASDFREISGVMLPYRIDRTVRGIVAQVGTIGAAIQTLSVVVKEYKINDPSNIESAYTIMWPKGTFVADTRTGQNFTVQKDETIDDSALAQALKAKLEGAQQRNAIPSTRSGGDGGDD